MRCYIGASEMCNFFSETKTYVASAVYFCLVQFIGHV